MKKKLLLTYISIIYSFNIFAINKNVKDTTFINQKIDEIKIISAYSDRYNTDPISITTFSKDDIRFRLGNKEFVEVLNAMPSTYATKKGGGYGDSRISIRGFDSNNISILINGVPVNSLENNSIYWSNWVGLADATRGIQMQRGIGLSRLGLFSAGGTLNILTEQSSIKSGGEVFYKTGNDGYNSMGINYSSGLLKNNWLISLMGTKSYGDGYIKGTNFEAYSYHLNVVKYINQNHKLSLTFFGSPQWHNMRGNMHYIKDYENHPDGLRMNTSFGYINGEVTPTWGGYNEYHKPMLNLNYYWQINKKSYLTAVIYGSFANGGGRKLYGKQNKVVDSTTGESSTYKYIDKIQYNYQSGRANVGISDFSMTANGGGFATNLTSRKYIDYAPIMSENMANKDSYAIFAKSVNSHQNYGTIINYSRQLNSNLILTTGIDFRYYICYHYDQIDDLLGGAYYVDSWNSLAAKDKKMVVGDRIGQDYDSEIIKSNIYGHLQWQKNQFNSFISATLASDLYRRKDEGKFYSAKGSKLPLVTDWESFLPYSIKLGASYKFAKQHYLFVNGGHTTRTPEFSDLFIDNEPLKGTKLEKISTVEFGYGISASKLDLNLTGYFTKWEDRSLVVPIGGWSGPKAYIPGVDAVHKGIEMQITYMPLKWVMLKGQFSYGDWRWKNDVAFTLVDENNNRVGDYNAYIKNLKVGDAPQLTSMIGAVILPIKTIKIGIDALFYDNHYASFNPETRNDADDRTQAWKLPAYSNIAINIEYKIPFKNKTELTIHGGVDNLFDCKYISDARDGLNHDRNTAQVWYGFGRTWSFGTRFNF